MSRSSRPNKKRRKKCCICGARDRAMGTNGRCFDGKNAVGCYGRKREKMFDRKNRIAAFENRAVPLRRRGHFAKPHPDGGTVVPDHRRKS